MRTVWRVLTGRGRSTVLVAVLAAVAGVAWQYPLVAGLGGALLLVVVVEVVSVLVTSEVRVHREVAPRVVVRNDPCEGTLRVTGRRRHGLVRVEASDAVDGRPVPVHLPEGVRGASVSVSYPVPTPRRGLLSVGPVRLRRYGVVGMAAATTEAGTVDQVRVLPRRVPVAAMVRGYRRATMGADTSSDFGGTDIVGLHEYVLGDDLRRLHWPTSARTGTLMVREDADPSEPHVCVLLDDRAGAYGGDAPAEAFEEAVEVAAALCHAALERGHPLRFATVTGRHQVVVPGSPTRMTRQETQELDWLFAEVTLVPEAATLGLGRAGYDVVVAVTGTGADLQVLAARMGDAPSATVAVVDEQPGVGAEQQAGVLVLRGGSSYSLAAAWDQAASR